VNFERGDVRFDAGFGEGDAISAHYDSMIAKLIVWGADREQAVRRMESALAQTHIVGLHTNVSFLGRVVASTSFVTADLDTALIERERAALFEFAPLPPEWVAASVAAHVLTAGAADLAGDPWSARNGWRMHGQSVRSMVFDCNGSRSTVTLSCGRGSHSVGVLGRQWAFDFRRLPDSAYDISMDHRRMHVSVYAIGDRFSVISRDGTAEVWIVDPLSQAGSGADASSGLCAPMPGKVIAFLARSGDTVVAGQPLAVMEAMKMEHTIAAPRDGLIEELLYAVGDQVDEGNALLRMAAA
jgi:3-methylcrotonyl-CoA carboxylase alpha subunit